MSFLCGNSLCAATSKTLLPHFQLVMLPASAGRSAMKMMKIAMQITIINSRLVQALCISKLPVAAEVSARKVCR